MSDLISRQALRNAMYHEAFETDTEMQRWDSGCWIRYKLFENVIDNLPTAQPYTDTEIQTMQDLEQAQFEKVYQLGYEEGKKDAQAKRKGHWILTEDDNYEYCTCSVCGYQNGENWMNGSDIPFCAMCGADMRGENDEKSM